MNSNTFFLALNSIAKNFFSQEKLFLVSEPANWSIYEDCRNIQKNLALINAQITYLPFGLKNKVIHFASENTFLRIDSIRNEKWYEKIHCSNKIIFTWFHISEQDAPRLHLIPLLNSQVDIVHTASQNTKEKLIKYGLNKEKIVVVPIGVNLDIFHPVSKEEKNIIKNNLRLPENKIIIGSFQKDGHGWGNGIEPKHIKGPDIFCDVVEKLSKKYPVHVLLTGPSRGYVKNRLKKAGITYTHSYLQNFTDIAQYYRALDLYLVTSREEGGPKALLESLASGVPLISTRVGMAPEIIEDKKNGFLTNIEDVSAILEKADLIINDQSFRSQIIQEGLKTAQAYSIKKTVQSMYNLMYDPLLKLL